MNVLNLFTTFVERFRSTPWRSVFKHTEALRRFFIRTIVVATGSVNRETAIACYRFAKRIMALYRKSGALFTSLYLKQCSTCLMRFYSGSREEGSTQMSGAFVSLCKSGIPVLIPRHHRSIIRTRDSRADHLVFVYLSLFSVCRIIKLAKPIGAHTFKSMVTPVEDMDKIREMLGEIKTNCRSIILKHLPWINEVPLKKGFQFVPSWKSLPNEELSTFPIKEKDGEQYRDCGRPIEEGRMPQNCFFTSMKYEIAAFARQLRLIHSWEGIFSPGILFQAGFILYPFDIAFSTKVANIGLEFYERRVGLVFDNLAQSFGSHPLYTGRIAQSLEGAGKRRIFVIGNWTKQRLLYPVHEWAMSVLRRIPQDGTFHQEAPITLLAQRRSRYMASFDLSAATDRWPVAIIHDIVACIFGPSLASCIVNGCLALNSCSISGALRSKKRKGSHKVAGFEALSKEAFSKLSYQDKALVHKYRYRTDKSRHEICFVAGQPLGYYASWALFAFSHHFMVWLAAHRVNPESKRPFDDYALLGDDIVIANRAVANEYRRILDQLQVSISDAKSIVSKTGCLEFAKKFWVKGLTKNLSPVSAKAILCSNSLSGIQQLAFKYNLTPRVCLKLNGAGYRVLGSMDTSKLSRKFKRVQALSNKRLVNGYIPSLEFWIGRGNPISPYLMGVFIHRSVGNLKLKQLKTPPGWMYWSEGEEHIAENTSYRHWMASWLVYLKWYVLITSEPSPRLIDIFSPPVISFSYTRREDEINIFSKSWSGLYELYDMAEGYSIGWCPPCLTGGYLMLEEPRDS